ncbi:helix-turn-helix domain-containing protein [Acholeplasma equifetale]|uniref:helix-turn-helix domain-containing protein n=1 Tax=Acholeplasma equifetale TaxID=264634 RepID=UPI00047ECCE7|nr:helix-turn-helix transcriptional regulator [Acholeplasma equifetale]
MDYLKLIIQIRARLNLSQSDLGKLIGVSFSTINRWENGKSIPTKKHLCMLENICKENRIEVEEGK